MANNTQNPKTKVNPLNAGLGIEGLKGYNPQEKTQEVKKESRVYTVTKNDGTQVDKSYTELSPAEKTALNKNAGVVSGGKTDIERQYSVAPSSVGTKPTRNITTGSGLATATSIVTPIALGAITKGIPGAIAGAAMSAINAISAGANASEIERRYQEAMREYNDKISKSAKVAGSWEKDEDGNLIFMPDYSKVGEDISVEASGAKIADLFNLNDNTEPNVYFGDDGVLHIDINRAFANTKEYNDIINSISSDYAGLTKDTADVDAYLSDFRQRLSSALDQYRFEVNRIAGYKSKLPNASTETIMDAARGEIGAMLSDADKKDWKVKVYRDGNLVESTAKDVLDHVYNMDKYERNDYIEGLADALEDDSISDNEKAYVLAEYNLLFSASDADVKEGDASKERKKYAEMLDQDFAVTVLRSSRLIRGFDTLADSVAGLVSQGTTDDILLANQDYLEPEEVAQNFGSVFGTAFDIYASQKIMQGLEQKIVRPVLGAGARAIGGRLINAGSDKIADIGRKMIEASGTYVINRAGDIIGYRTALDITGVKNAALANIIKAFSGEGSISYRLLAKGGAQVMTYMMGEIAINATSDALYDVAKLGTATLSGDIKSGDEAAEYLKNELGQDLVMDTIIQFGPQGLIDLHTTMDAIRLQNIEPYARGVAEARTKYGEAVSAVDEAKANGKSTKKLIRELENNAVSAKNDLTKAETEYADARKEWIGSKSQQFGSKIAELESRLTESEMFRKFQESVMDENVAGTALAKSAYAASGGDVELFNRLLNTVSNNLRTVTRITANEMSSDKWAKGTGEAYNAFKHKYSELASRTGKMSKTDIDYIKAQNELIRYTEAAKGDKKLIADANAFYSKYIDAVSPDRAAQLDELMDTMREAINKTNESAIGAGIQTEENIQTKREATGFQEQGYIPMYLKKKNKTGHYIIPQERNLDRTWDRGEFWDLDNLENPALNVLTYINYTARNIALNERNKAVIAATEIPGMRTYRTDVDNEVIRTEDGNVYKHSDIVDHMEQKINKRLSNIEKVKKETPTELEFADEKNKILYGKTDGTHKELVKELGGQVSSLKVEEAKLRSELATKEKAQEDADVDDLFSGTSRFEQPEDLSDKLVDTGRYRSQKTLNLLDVILPEPYSTGWKSQADNPYNSLMPQNIVGEYAANVAFMMERVLGTEYGKKAYSGRLKAFDGDAKALATDIGKTIYRDVASELASSTGNIDVDDVENAFTKHIYTHIRNQRQADAFTKMLNSDARSDFLARKRQAVDWWNSTERLRRRLGVESYAYGLTNERATDFDTGGNGLILGVRRISYKDDPNGGFVIVGPEEIKINLMAFRSLPEMKSTIVHEAAHVAFGRAANRVPLLTDALRMLGVDAKVSQRVADSTDATELIAYMTQKRFQSDFATKTPEQITEMFLNDSTVQTHLNGLMRQVNHPPVKFKERFIEQVQNIITFVKAKLTASSSLRDVKTLNDFYYGLVTGKFAPDMRINISGEKASSYPEYNARTGGVDSALGDVSLDWSKIPLGAERLAMEIVEVQEKIDANSLAQAEARNAVRAKVAERINALKKYYDDTYSKFGYTTGVRVSQAKIDAFIEQGDMDGLATYLESIKDRASLAPPTDQTLSDTALDKQATGLEIEIKRSLNKNFPGLNNEQKREVLARVLGEFRAKAAKSGDATAAQVANEAFARNVGYPITYYDAGEEKTAYITGPLAKSVYEMCVRSENVADRNFVQVVFENAAKLKRYATTAIDATRALPNLLRDTLRGDVMSGGTDYAGARKIFADILDAEGLTAEQKAKAMESVELAIRTAQGQTLNAAIENRTERGLQDMVRETRQEGKNAVSRIIWDVTHGRIGDALETPMNVAESFTRRRMAQSAYIREFKDAKYTSTSFDERLAKAYDAGINAGIENTTNFSRRGAMVGAMARYVPYFQQKFSNIESAKISFMKDPAGVAARAAIFQYAFVMSLANTLKKEETRRAYYNLSDYDRKNNIVFSLDGETLVTIPLDESLASLITPWRRTVETLNNVDPGTFASIFTDTLLDMSPVDLDGFTEGDSLNVRRGVEKLASQVAPSLATELLQTFTGYNLYYGSDNKVTDESLAQRGLTAQSAGDYTTTSANSKLLRKVADATGIPQWMLQQTVSNFGGNVGQYVLNTLDKLAGASKDEQGGKEFVNAVFKSMTGTDSNNANNQFYNGMNLLRKERVKVVNKLQSLNDDIATATGAEQADLRKQYQKVKDDYAMKVSNFVDQYLNAYEITGGLAASQAQQIYWLFNLYDDNTVYESGSVGEYYQNLAKQEANKDATSWAAPVLDKYYDQTQNVYKDASGTWKYSSPYGERAYYNTIWGQGMKHQVGLRNLIEGITSDLKSARSAAYSARSAAMASGDYDRYDQIGADFDARVIKAIDPYIKEYGAENVLNNSSVLDYLEEWFFVPSSFMRTKKGRYVPSLANNASKQRAFVRPYIKSLYGVNTGYTEKNYENLLNPEVFPNE